MRIFGCCRQPLRHSWVVGLPRSLSTSDLALKHVSPGGVREDFMYAQFDCRPSGVGGAAGTFTCRVLPSLTSLA